MQEVNGLATYIHAPQRLGFVSSSSDVLLHWMERGHWCEFRGEEWTFDILPLTVQEKAMWATRLIVNWLASSRHSIFWCYCSMAKYVKIYHTSSGELLTLRFRKIERGKLAFFYWTWAFNNLDKYFQALERLMEAQKSLKNHESEVLWLLGLDSRATETTGAVAGLLQEPCWAQF